MTPTTKEPRVYSLWIAGELYQTKLTAVEAAHQVETARRFTFKMDPPPQIEVRKDDDA